MNIALLGYGRMGHDVEQAAVERGHTISARYSSLNPLPYPISADVKDIACAIDFSVPAAAVRHIEIFTRLHIPIIVGTTGWNDQLPSMMEFVRKHEGTLLYASNFSVGAHIFFHAVTEAAKLLDRFPGYDVAIHETHHRLKKDAPSGTALTIAKKILNEIRRKTKIVTSLNGALQPHELLVSSSRVGSGAGTHSVLFDSPVDAIQLTHSSYNRRGFALGAVSAAEWIQGKKGVFTMENFLFNT